MNKIVYKHESGMYVEYVRERFIHPGSQGDYDDSDAYTSVEEFHRVMLRNGMIIASFAYHNWGRDKADRLRAKHTAVDQAISFLHLYRSLAYEGGWTITCHNILPNRRIETTGLCPLLRLTEDGQAKCSVAPMSYGYCAGGKRDLPKDQVCDLPQWKYAIETFRFRMTGRNGLTMADLIQLSDGTARKWIEEPAPKEYVE